MPCKQCENGKWKWGDDGECRYDSREECERDNAETESVGNDFLWSVTEFAASQLSSKLSDYYEAITSGPAVDAGRDGLPIRVTQGIAVIPLMGMMIRRGGPIARMFGLAGTDSVRLAIESALADEDVKEILLRIDSPGGSVSGLDQLGDTINSAEKPVTAIVEGMAASAAYYAASQADQLFVGRTDLVGSIGTRLMLYDFSKMFENEGIEPVPIDTGEFKSAGALGTKITEAQRDEFQRIVDFYFDDFVSVVARGRGMTENAVREVADGRMFTPQSAQELGLIDGVSTLERVLNDMRNKNRQTMRSTDAARARMQLTDVPD